MADRHSCYSFLSSLLPPTTETMQHVLTQGGITPYLAAHHDPTFTSLLSETRSLLQSSDFERVLERSLDRAVEILFDGLQKNVFVDPDMSVGGVGVGLSGEDSVRLRLAGLLPGLARWSHLALNSLPNELVDVSTSFFVGAEAILIVFMIVELNRCERGGCLLSDNVFGFRRSISLTVAIIHHQFIIDRSPI